MSRVRGRDTNIERALRSELQRKGMRFRKHASDLPGKPDIVFFQAKVAVFVDGDFWHGFRFPRWQEAVSLFWRTKIAKNRARDQKNFRKLRALGWQVLRLWQHSIEADLDGCVGKVMAAVLRRKA
jgi:DNA mismatch endonuclease (patch repair protein)